MADAPAVLGLAHDYDRRFFGGPVLARNDLLALWGSLDLVLSRDTEAWLDGERLVGYATLDARGDLELGVDDGWAWAGLEEVLLSRWEAAAGRRGLAEVGRYLAAADAGGADRLLARGYVARYTCWVLSLDPEVPLPERALPAGYAVRPFAEPDAAAVHVLVRDAFAEWGGVPRSFAAWRATVLDRPDVTPAHHRVVTYQGAVVGACLVIDPDPTGPPDRPEAWVAQLAVHPGHRRRGLAARLLAHTGRAARERGTPYLGLSTDTRTGALGLYQGLGMRVRHTLVRYALDLGDPDEASAADWSAGRPSR
jgi:mycothiol synthase